MHCILHVGFPRLTWADRPCLADTPMSPANFFIFTGRVWAFLGNDYKMLESPFKPTGDIPGIIYYRKFLPCSCVIAPGSMPPARTDRRRSHGFTYKRPCGYVMTDVPEDTFSVYLKLSSYLKVKEHHVHGYHYVPPRFYLISSFFASQYVVFCIINFSVTIWEFKIYKNCIFHYIHI